MPAAHGSSFEWGLVSAIMAERWPSELQVQRCRETWTKVTAKERCDLTMIACVDVVAYLHDTNEQLSSVDAGQVLGRRQAPSLPTPREIYRLCGLEWSEWSGDWPRVLRLGGDICGAEDGMDFMLETCVKTTEELLDVARRTASGRSSELSWGAYAREFFSLVIHDMLTHMDKAASHDRGLRSVRAALTPPPPSKTRSWPPKRVFAELKEAWVGMDCDERLGATMLSASTYWFVQACDVAMVTTALKHTAGQSAEMSLMALEKLRTQSKLLGNLEVQESSQPVMLLKRDYVMEKGCLDELYGMSVRQGTEKDDLVEKALLGCYEELFNPLLPDMAATSRSTWRDVERVAATLILDGFIQRHELKRRHLEATAALAALSQEAALKKKRAKAKRREAAEKERRVKERLGRELEVRLSEERSKVLALLERAPSWDISWVRVRRTFIDVEEETRVSPE